MWRLPNRMYYVSITMTVNNSSSIKTDKDLSVVRRHITVGVATVNLRCGVRT